MARTLILCRHGESTWNVERRYQGRLDSDLSPLGIQQAEALRDRLATRQLTAIYTGPLRRTRQTADIVAAGQPSAAAFTGPLNPQATQSSAGEPAPATPRRDVSSAQANSDPLRATLGQALGTSPPLVSGQASDEAAPTPVIVRPELVDVDHGDWSGRTHDEVEERWPELAHQWRERPATVRFPGGESLTEVRARAISFLAWLRHEYADGQLLVVTHGEVLQLLLGHCLEMSAEHLRRMPADNCHISIVEDYDIPLTMAINDGCHLQGLRSSSNPRLR